MYRGPRSGHGKFSLVQVRKWLTILLSYKEALTQHADQSQGGNRNNSF